MNETTPGKHVWKFFRAGGFDQVRLDTGADLKSLSQLDQKLWVALACPSRGLEFDPKTLDLIDTNKDGRIRAPEILAATQWAITRLKDPGDLIKSPASLPLSSINEDAPEGKQLLASAKQILVNLGKADADAVTVEDTSDTAKIFGQTLFNGDGIITADSTGDAALKAILEEIISCLGAETDRSGKPGINQAKVDQFFTEAESFSEWWKKAEADKASALPLGDATAGAVATLQAARAKVDDYFARCRLASFDPRAHPALNRDEAEYVPLAAKDLSLTVQEVAGFPLAHVEAGKPLPLVEGVNPAWADAITKLRAEVVKPLLGERNALTEEGWTTVKAKLAGYESWSAGKAGAAAEKLGLARVREILAGGSRAALTTLVEKDKALEPEANAIADVDRLARYCRDLYKLLNNYVSFRDFYGRQTKAIFQAGTLYLDQRSCDLCLPVEDPAKHATMAGLAGAYLLYCDCVRKATGEKMQIVAALTNGDTGNLMVGRNGIFYDRKGGDWDATVTKIVENPISLRQAFWAPYRKLVRMIEEQVAKRAAAAEAASSAKLESVAATAEQADKAKAPPAPPKKLDIGIVAALGVAVGAIGTAISALVTGLLQLAAWQIPLVFVAIALVISGPSVLIAWLKLRKRNLGPILDANGWAVNAKSKINIPFGRSLTQVASLPPGSQRQLRDPYREKRSPWPWIILAALLLWGIYAILNSKGLIHRWTDGFMGSPAEQQVEKAKEEAKPPAKK